MLNLSYLWMKAVTALWHSPARASSPGHSPHWCFDKVTLIQLFSYSEQTVISAGSLTAFGVQFAACYCPSLSQVSSTLLHWCSEPAKCNPALEGALAGDIWDGSMAELHIPLCLCHGSCSRTGPTDTAQLAGSLCAHFTCWEFCGSSAAPALMAMGSVLLPASTTPWQTKHIFLLNFRV